MLCGKSLVKVLLLNLCLEHKKLEYRMDDEIPGVASTNWENSKDDSTELITKFN